MTTGFLQFATGEWNYFPLGESIKKKIPKWHTKERVRSPETVDLSMPKLQPLSAGRGRRGKTRITQGL